VDDGPGAFRCYLEIPHSVSRFPGYDNEGDEFSAEVHRNHIFGKNVADYMVQLEEDEETFKRQFSQYLKHGVTADKIEGTYTAAHAAIRADPSVASKDKAAFKGKRWGRKRLTKAQRDATVAQKKAAFLKKMEEDDDE